MCLIVFFAECKSAKCIIAIPLLELFFSPFLFFVFVLFYYVNLSQSCPSFAVHFSSPLSYRVPLCIVSYRHCKHSVTSQFSSRHNQSPAHTYLISSWRLPGLLSSLSLSLSPHVHPRLLQYYPKKLLERKEMLQKPVSHRSNWRDAEQFVQLFFFLVCFFCRFFLLQLARAHLGISPD